MAIDTIKSTAVLDGTIATADIADGAVSGVKLANNLNYDSGTLYLDSTNNRVGVGTTTPTHPLTVNGQIKSIGANGETIQLQTSSQYSGVSFVGSDGTRDAIIDYDHTTGIMGLKAHTSGHAINFATGGYTERMRINSSGDLLVGKTSVDYTTVGFEATPSSTFQANAMTADGKKALLLARKTSDGEIVQFRKDTTSVGSIGTSSGNFFLSGASKGFRFGSSSVVPSSSTGADSDNNFDLGYSSSRFKDLYLSGGAYLGGTGSANHLDDYEEGTFTSTITFDDATDFSPDQTTTVTAYYTKIGRICHVIWPQMGVVSVSALNIGDIIAKGSLPFTAANNGGIATGPIYPYSVRGRYYNSTHDDASFTVFVVYNTSIANFQSAHRTYGGGWIELLGSASYIYASLTYETA